MYIYDISSLRVNVWGRIHDSRSLTHTKVRQVLIFYCVRDATDSHDTLHLAYEKFKRHTAGFFMAPRNQLELMELLLP